jgi:hypothetical protein
MEWGRVTYPFFLKCLKTQLNYLKMNARKITNPSQALEFLQGGNATATFVGQSSRYTYKVRKADKGDMYFVSLLVGANNESDYLYIGCINDQRGFFQTAKSNHKGLAPALAFGFIYSRLLNGVIDSRTEIWHEGRCCKCGRKLTTPESIERGMGAECSKG